MWQKKIESAGFRSISAFRNVKKPLEPNIEQDDEVLILTDTEHDPAVWKLIAAAVRDLGAHPIVSMFEAREMDYYDPPASVGRQMKDVDVVITCTTTAMLHSPAGEAAMESGVPIIAMDGGLTIDMLTNGAATADYNEVERLEYEIGKRVFEGGSEAHLTSGHGTNLTLSVEDRVFLYREPDPDDQPLELYENDPGSTRSSSRAASSTSRRIRVPQTERSSSTRRCTTWVDSRNQSNSRSSPERLRRSTAAIRLENSSEC